MLAAGPRDVMVPSRAHDTAREDPLQAGIVTDNRGFAMLIALPDGYQPDHVIRRGQRRSRRCPKHCVAR
jgi:hypothetical protein